MSRSLQRLTFSLYQTSTSFLSLLQRLFSKTLRFLSFMDSFLLSPHDDVVFGPDPSPLSDLSLSLDPLFLVPFRWWSEAATEVAGQVAGVRYNATSLLKRDDYADSEVVLSMQRQGQTEKGEEGVSGDDGGGGCDEELALVSQWMFLKALKWHNDVKNVEEFLSTGDGLQDLFSLQIRLSFVWEKDSLLIRIGQKDNAVDAFNRAYFIFCGQSDLLQIWDFSGQTNQFFLSDKKLSNDSGLFNDEILLELQVYGFLCTVKSRESKKNGSLVEQSRNEHGLLKVNGSSDNVNPYASVTLSPRFGSNNTDACALGLTGLCNLGNTCFMNSAIQCLVHTEKLVDYFLGDFRRDLNFENPLGMNGKLALAFGDLLRKLWTPGSSPVTPKMFKATIAGFAPQFSGYNQHDSQEFLAFLLDGLHEDLNRVKRKPYVEVKDGNGRPDGEVAEEHWQNHLSRNNSIIVDLYQGQYRSSLVCPICQKLSITFDPFMYLSLPLPSTTMRTMTLTIISTKGTTLPSPVTVTVPKYGRYKDLVHALSISCSLGDDEILLVAEIYNHSIFRILDDPSDSIELIRDDDRLVAYRLPKDSDGSSLVVFTHQNVETSYGDAIISSKKFGIPLVTSIYDLSKGSEIQKAFLKLISTFLLPVEDSSNGYGNAKDAANKDSVMEDVIIDGDANAPNESGNESDVENEFSFYLEKTIHSSKIQMDEPLPVAKFPKVIEVIVLWPEKMIENYDTSLLSLLPEVCKPAFISKTMQESVSLYTCLDAFLKEEPLGPEDMWYCPNCEKHRQASKKLDLWRLPEILVIHLKRFSYNRYFKNKLETYVDFPIDDFDLSSYILHKNRQISYNYTLYAIINHYGGLGGGHYTAFAQYGQDRWYEFDDSRVFPVSEEQIKSSAAYVLFYRRISDISCSRNSIE